MVSPFVIQTVIDAVPNSHKNEAGLVHVSFTARITIVEEKPATRRAPGLRN